jgi:hypothetical protein
MVALKWDTIMDIKPFEPPRNDSPPTTKSTADPNAPASWLLAGTVVWTLFLFLGIPLVQVVPLPMKVVVLSISLGLIGAGLLNCRGIKLFWFVVICALLILLLFFVAQFPVSAD